MELGHRGECGREEQGQCSDPGTVVPSGACAGQGLLVCVFVGSHTVVIVLVIQIALAPCRQLEVV